MYICTHTHDNEQGAIVALSMVHPELGVSERVDRILDFCRKLSGADDTSSITMDSNTYASEVATGHRNRCVCVFF